MRVIRLALAAFAVMALSAIAASSAAAALEATFTTKGGGTVLFTGEGSNPVLHGLQAGVAATVNCEKVLIHGFILNNSTLVHMLGIIFEDKCTQTVGSTTSECNPLLIKTKPILAELGFVKQNELKRVAILMAPGDGTTEFAKFTCGGMTTTVGGVVVGEIPEISGVTNQYNKELTKLEVKFETTAVGSDQQKITTIFLLGKEMTAQELKVEGFLGGKAAQEATATLTSAEGVTLNT